MRVADTYVGNVNDDGDVADRVDAAGDDVLTVTVDGTERRRSRFRTTADDGTDLGVVVGRELRAGDVLAADGTLVRVSLKAVEAMVIDLGGVAGDADAVTAALELGHAVGNRHWDLAVDGDRACLPVADARGRMAAEVEASLPDGATVDYEDVSPSLFDDADAGHAHPGGRAHGGGHEHSSGHDHTGRHDHTSGHDHTGGHGHSSGHDHGAGHDQGPDDDHAHSHGGDGRGHGARDRDPEGSL